MAAELEVLSISLGASFGSKKCRSIYIDFIIWKLKTLQLPKGEFRIKNRINERRCRNLSNILPNVRNALRKVLVKQGF